MSFCFDILINNFGQSGGKDLLLMEENICAISPEVTSCFSIKRASSNNDLSIFDSFIDLFNKNPSGYRYFPSYFQTLVNPNSNFLIIKPITLLSTNETTVNPEYLSITKEVISYNQYLLLEQHNNHLNAILNDLCKILLEYRESNNI